MKFKELLKENRPEDIFMRIGVSLAVNAEDQNRQLEQFKKAYKRILSMTDQDSPYLIYTLKGTFYERPDATAIDSFMFKKDDLKDYQYYNELEQYMIEDQKRNKKVDRLETKEIKPLIEKTPLPKSVAIEEADWADVLNAEVLEDNVETIGTNDFVCCVVDLMMKFDSNEEKSHRMVKKNEEENNNNPLTFGHRRRLAFVRHLYEYKILQTLSHKEISD